MLEWLFGKKKQPEQQPKKQKPKKTKVEEEAEDRWMYEFVVQFLNSPIWRVSILDFVDEKCIVFDNEEENKFEYTTIHNQFKELVGNLFDGMMQEVGLTEDRLILILEKGFQSKEKKLFNQLFLCDDFLKFKELMLRRNKALETEALQTMNRSDIKKKSKIEKERDMIRSSQIAEKSRKRELEQQEEQILRKVLQQSRLEAEQRQVIERLELQAATKEIEEKEKLEKSKKLEETKQQQKPKQTEKEKETEKEKAKEQTQVNTAESKPKMTKKLNPIGVGASMGASTKLGDLPPLRGTQKKQVEQIIPPKEEVVEEKVEEVKKEEPKEEFEEKPKVENHDDRKKRLLQQRQKIKKKKEEERRKMMQEEAEQPKQVNTIVLQDDGIHESTVPQMQVDEKVSKDEVERRKAIMKRIKNRIVDDF